MATTAGSVNLKTPSCEFSWVKFEIGGVETCLKVQGKGSISNAASACKLIGAKLPLPISSQENTDLFKAIKSLGLNGASLDCFRLANTSKWLDSSSNICSYFIWQPGQPNSPNNRGVYISLMPNGQWNDFWGDSKQNYVCQKATL